MSGFPTIQAGMKLTPVGRSGIMGRNKANTVLAVCNAVLNSKIVQQAQKPEFHITPNNAVYDTSAVSASTSSLAMHPFKLYPTGEFDGSGNHGYQVRTGWAQFRPIFHHPGTILPYAGAQFPFYGQLKIPDGTDGAPVPDLDKIITPATYWLDPTPEIHSGVNYGSYYAFYIRIVPDTDNGSSWDGSVSVQYHRFSLNALGGGGSSYDAFVYPGLPDVNGYEYLPIAVVQVTAATDPFFAENPTNDFVDQYIHDNYVNLYPTGQSGMNGFCFQGDWILPLPDAAISSANRIWYPGDTVRYYNGTPGDIVNGCYVSSTFGTIANPPSNLVQIGRFDP